MAPEKNNGVDSQEPKPESPRAGQDNGSTGQTDQDPEAAVASMGHDEQPTQQLSAFKGLGLLDRYLALWIFLAMAIGIILGNFVPETGPALQKGKFVGVSVPIGMFHQRPEFLIAEADRVTSCWPARHDVSDSLQSTIRIAARALLPPGDVEAEKQICFSIFVNWIVAPFLMLALAWAFLPDKPELRTGLILVGLGRCIAMVLIWNGLAGGNDEYCAILVAINSILQMILFAPMAIFFIRIISHESDTVDISYSVVATSVAVFLGIPLGAAIITRFVARLLYTILVLFASQGRQVVHQIVSVVRVAAPLIAYFVLIFFVTLWISRLLGFRFSMVVTQSFTAASNNFELAIAVAVATFGPNSDQALASTVGPLIEVPVLIGLVYAVRWMANRWGWK
ncbi:hypothetical protein FANTH_14871 [Fusarium anthophilum]|uniref:Arsenical-resistance protein n=1 Tax=Fusarium anthophilum TaxID=48485 RepID=A0A8H4YG45_9HYPO|nr:hypothetical protein FANTH_14871 [Fusarium anthophilum]